jgi:hypothetical protein
MLDSEVVGIIHTTLHPMEDVCLHMDTVDQDTLGIIVDTVKSERKTVAAQIITGIYMQTDVESDSHHTVELVIEEMLMVHVSELDERLEDVDLEHTEVLLEDVSQTEESAIVTVELIDLLKEHLEELILIAQTEETLMVELDVMVELFAEIEKRQEKMVVLKEEVLLAAQVIEVEMMDV